MPSWADLKRRTRRTRSIDGCGRFLGRLVWKEGGGKQDKQWASPLWPLQPSFPVARLTICCRCRWSKHHSAICAADRIRLPSSPKQNAQRKWINKSRRNASPDSMKKGPITSLLIDFIAIKIYQLSTFRGKPWNVRHGRPELIGGMHFFIVFGPKYWAVRCLSNIRYRSSWSDYLN